MGRQRVLARPTVMEDAFARVKVRKMSNHPAIDNSAIPKWKRKESINRTN